ncbi:MAG: hypothetical protein LBR39_08565 [Coriobacteriales bacterium]|jgi:uncharacterized protein (DUF697 family)|nr:hypothetical protein [Coriobacteriales bacterium]
MPKLPLDFRQLTKAIGLAAEESQQPLTLKVLVDGRIDGALMSQAQQALRPLGDNLQVEVSLLTPETVLSGDSSLLLLFAANAAVAEKVLIAALLRGIPAVAVQTDAITWAVAPVQGTALGDSAEFRTSPVAPAEEGDLAPLFLELGRWMVQHLREQSLAWARNLVFVRKPYVQEAILATSVQNAAISAIPILPGADLPLLALNQVRLFLKIGAAWGLPVDNGRLKEIALLVGSSFGFRALARRLVGLVPVFGWAMRAAVGFGGTQAVGRAADEYFALGGDLAGLAATLAGRGGGRGVSGAQGHTTRSPLTRRWYLDIDSQLEPESDTEAPGQ